MNSLEDFIHNASNEFLYTVINFLKLGDIRSLMLVSTQCYYLISDHKVLWHSLYRKYMSTISIPFAPRMNMAVILSPPYITPSIKFSCDVNIIRRINSGLNRILTISEIIEFGNLKLLSHLYEVGVFHLNEIHKLYDFTGCGKYKLSISLAEIALYSNKFEIIEFLFSISPPTDSSQLYAAAVHSNERILKLFISSFVGDLDINRSRFKDKITGNIYNNQTVLHIVLQQHNIESVKLLVSYGANIQTSAYGQYAAMEIAFMNRNFEMLKYLIFLIVEDRDHLGISLKQLHNKLIKISNKKKIDIPDSVTELLSIHKIKKSKTVNNISDNDHTLFTGKRGGQYYMSTNGNKVYVKKK